MSTNLGKGAGASSVSSPGSIFFASCVSLVVTAMVFAVRGDIMGDLAGHFKLDPVQFGWVMGLAFWGFTISIFVGGQLCDLLGMKAIMGLAFIFHLSGILLTIFAPGYAVLAIATLVIGMGNGFVEAAINPLTATIYPDKKTQKLNAMHAWWPGGLVIGSVASFFLSRIGQTWQIKMWMIAIPTLLYGAMFLRLKLPKTERVQSGVSTGAMYKEALRPLFLIWLVCMLLTAATELGTTQWVGEIMKKTVFAAQNQNAGILVLAWISLIMLIGRLFAGPVVHKLSPIGLLIGSAAISAVGLFAMGRVTSPVSAYVASFIFAVGVCYFWPTMLGVTSERFPRGGALLMGLMGAAGMASAGLAQPLLGNLYKTYGAGGALRNMAVLPVVLVVVFAIIFVIDLTKGGYKAERLSSDDELAAAMADGEA
jgi:MFS family permease